MNINIQGVLNRFDLLKKQMGIEEEPDINWPEFGGQGLEVGSLKEVVANSEGVLTWKGELCILYIREQLGLSDLVSSYKFHVVECDTVSKWRGRWSKDRYVVTNRSDGLFSACRREHDGSVGTMRLVRMKVCKNCLRALNWEDYENVQYRQKDLIVSAFSIQGFLDVYRNRTVRAAKRKPAPPPTPTAVVVQVEPDSEVAARPASIAPQARPPNLKLPGWAYDIPDEDFRAALVLLAQSGPLYEGDLSRMVDGPRRARRFARYIDNLPASCPVTIHVGTQKGQKIYRARRRTP